MFRIVGYRAGYYLSTAQVHSPPFPSLLSASVDCMGGDPDSLASGWIQTRVALTGDQKVGELSSWGYLFILLAFQGGAVLTWRP